MHDKTTLAKIAMITGQTRRKNTIKYVRDNQTYDVEFFGRRGVGRGYRGS
jgi:hypothetical protein